MVEASHKMVINDMTQLELLIASKYQPLWVLCVIFDSASDSHILL